MINSTKTHEILESAAFKKLVKTRWNISLTLTFIMLFVYVGFLLIIAYDKNFLKMPLGESINLAIVVGLGIIIFTWLITGVYVYWANNYYDASVAEIKKEL